MARLSTWGSRRLLYPPSCSLCMIMRDEEAVLDRCLRLARPLVNEIIIVDTGSTDASISIAQKHKCTIMHHPWVDDFAKVRNLGISRAKSDWILILDPDEYIDPVDHADFRLALFNWSAAAYLITTRNYTQNPYLQKFQPNDGRYPLTRHFKGFSPSIKTRLFQRKFGFKFSGIWHELLDQSIRDQGIIPLTLNTPVHHYCDAKENRTRAQRTELYLRLGKKKVTLAPDNGQAWNEYGVSLSIAGHYEKAYVSFLRAVSLGFINPSIYFSLCNLSLKLGRPACHDFFKEKAICAMSPALTHISPELKNPLPYFVS